MKIKLIILVVAFSISTSLANPVVGVVIKEGAKKLPKLIKVIIPIVISSVSELNADEIKEKKPISKKKLDLYKTKF